MNSYYSNTSLPLLYIDDNEDDRTIKKLAIERENSVFILYTAESAGAAKHFFDPKKDSRSIPALILLVYDLGDHTGTDFLTWLRLVRGITTLPVIMYSRSGLSSNVSECYASGANYFLRKPNTFESIQTMIRTLNHCVSFDPPRFGDLAELPEYEPDPVEHCESRQALDFYANT